MAMPHDLLALGESADGLLRSDLHHKQRAIWGDSRQKVPSTKFDLFALPKRHVLARTGILQPNLIEIPDLGICLCCFSAEYAATSF
jgi:hypothetical protein